MTDPTLTPVPPSHAPLIPPAPNVMALVSLIFGIVSWLFLPVLGAVTAVVLGHMARAEIRRAGPAGQSGDGLAVGGLILGYTQLVLCALILGFFVLVFAGIIGLGLGVHH